ncbi:MAG: peptide-methionine (S)-S-oxide reductase MsrA, partial [Pyrinomonadaceae bacterium]
MSLFTKIALATSVLLAVGCGIAASSANTTERANTTDLKALAPAAEPVGEPLKGTQTAVFAGGCFWGVEAVFENVKGVSGAKSGYSGGDARTAKYEEVSSGDTTHAESVLVTFDPTKVTYTQLLSVFFSVAHDPTEVNRQGPDTGPQYRSAIFYTDAAQTKAAEDYIKAIDAAKVFAKPVATKLAPLVKFYD